MKPRTRPLCQALDTALGAPRVDRLRRDQAGMSLLEVIVAAGLVTLLTAGVYTMYGPSSMAAKINTQSDFLGQLRRNVGSAYQSANTFSGISVDAGLLGKWYPSASPESAWGSFALAPATNPSTGTANDSWKASYSAVPSEACGRLVANQINQWDQVTVGGALVQNVQDAINECALHTTTAVAFVRYGGRRSDGAALSSLCFNLKPGAPIPADCPASSAAPPPPSYTNPTPIPAPVVVTPPPATTPNTTQPTGPVVGLPATPSPPGTPPPATTPAPVPPAPTYPATCVVPSPSTQTQALACPSGQISSVSPYSSNGIIQSRTASCPDPYGSVAWTPWTTTSNTCAPICTAPATTSSSQTQTASCPSGQVTSGGSSTFTQSQTVTTTYSCPAPTGSYSSSTSYSGWSPASTSVCAPACVAPATTSTTQSQSASCPSGYVTTAGASSFTQSRTATTTYSCPAPTGSYSSSTSYTTWTPASTSVCYPACQAPANTSTPQYQTASCPAGYVTTAGASSFTQSRTATTTYSCPAPTGSYSSSTSYTTWSPASSSVCYPACKAPASSSTTQTQIVIVKTACPAPKLGYAYWDQNQTRTATTTYSCPAPTGSYSSSTSYSPWVNSGGLYNADYSGCYTCVSVDAYVIVRRAGIEQNMRASGVRVGDELRIMNPKTGYLRWGRVSYSKPSSSESVRITTESNVTLTCSDSAPIGLAAGGSVVSVDAKGKRIAMNVNGLYRVETVISVEVLGVQDVQHITCEDDFFLAGDKVGAYLAHHNFKIIQ